MANAVKEKDRTVFILVLITMITTVILLAVIAAGLILYNRANTAADIQEEAIEHMGSGGDVWEEEVLEEEEF